MSDKYIQTKGAGKGITIVTIVQDEHEDNKNIIVLETEGNFRYGVSRRDFENYYMLLNEWEIKQEKKKKNTGVGDPSLIAPTSESPISDARTRGEVPLKEQPLGTAD